KANTTKGIGSSPYAIVAKRAPIERKLDSLERLSEAHISRAGLFHGLVALRKPFCPEEAACYLEAYKALENKPPDGLMPEAAANTDQLAQITDFLTSVRPVTKADAASTVNTFKTVADIILADQDRLEACPGFGKRKAEKLYSVFRMPFLREQI
ncbi:hypothetical protein AHF37_08420, partial [Paragonimus kellicotti]